MSQSVIQFGRALQIGLKAKVNTSNNLMVIELNIIIRLTTLGFIYRTFPKCAASQSGFNYEPNQQNVPKVSLIQTLQ